MAAFQSHMTAERSWRSQTGSTHPACVRQLDAIRVNPVVCAITRKAKVDVDQPGCLRRGDP